MAKMTGLGKGLDALFGPAPAEEQVQDNDMLKTLKITEVEPNRNQPRKQFDEEALEELAESIKKYGLIQPIVVTKKDGYYQIVAGERRWRASKKAGMSTIQAIVREDDEKKNKEIALIENIQREDLNPIEKAKALRELIDKYHLTQQELADMLKYSRATINVYMKYLRDKMDSAVEIELGISSLRTDSVTPELVQTLVKGGQKTSTIAIEAASDRLRKFINKNLKEEQILDAIRISKENGLQGLKIYSMIGIPNETQEDIEEFIIYIPSTAYGR